MSLSTTTLTAAVGASALTVVLDDTGAITQIGMWLFLDGEAMKTTAAPNATNNTVAVSRGVGGSRALDHVSGATVYVGQSWQFYTQNPEGEPPTVPPVTPWINVVTGQIWTIVGGVWTLTGGQNPTGTVTGPASSTDGGVALWDGTTGTLLKDGPLGVTAGPFTLITSITVTNGVVTDLQGS